MAFVATFQGTANLQHVDAVKHSLIILEQKSRTQPGTVRYEFYQAPDDPATFLLFAIWENEADWQAHVASAAHDSHLERLPDGAWVSPPQQTRWRRLRD